MPIKDLSESVRLPRLGKIHLGTRHPEKGYPMKADHFVFPKDHSDYDKLVELYGEQPKELRVLIPVEDEETWATQYYRAYNLTYGQVCKGDGETATRMVDVKTKELPDAKKPGTVAMIEMPCLGRDCPEYKSKKCHEVMNLRFIMPEVPGLGVWQIDTGSKNSILNINSCAKVIKRAFGRVSMIPLKLTFEPMQVNNPETGKKQTVYVMNLRTDVTLAQLADAAREQSKMFMLEAPDLEHEYEVETEKMIDELWGEKEPEVDQTTGEIIEAKAKPITRGEYAGPKPQAKTAVADPEPEPEEKPETPLDAVTPDSEPGQEDTKGNGKPKRDPATIKSQAQLYKACFDDFKMQPPAVLKELGVTAYSEISDTPANCYLAIKSVKGDS